MSDQETMNEALNDKCELLLKNCSAIHRKYFLNDKLLSLMAGLIFASADKEADTDRLKECKKILDKNTGLLSNLRANPELVILSKMALSDDPEKYIQDVSDVYKKIHKGTQLENSYMALAAVLICDFGRQDEAEDLIAKAEQIKSLMNKEHPVLTSTEDTSFIMLLARTEKSVDTIIKDIDEAYDYLKRTCKVKASSDAVQGLCEVLAISYGDTKEKCDKVVRIFNTFSDRGAKFGTDSEFIVLGSLINANIDTDTLVNEVLEAEARLKDLKGFKDSEMDRKKRMMYASMLVAEVYGMQSAVIGNSIISNALSTVITKQIATAVSIAINLASAAIPSDNDKDSEKEQTN